MENIYMEKKINYGLSVLRVFMCFEVILNHLWSPEIDGKNFWIFLKLRPAAVPVFMIMSFYFMGRHFLDFSGKSFRLRIWRILYPQIGWAIIYFLAYKLYDIISGQNQLQIEDLFLQIIFGHSINQSMWYQFDLLIITLVFYAAFRYIPQKITVRLLIGVSICTLIIQYLGISYPLFDSLGDEFKYSIGRLFEVFPYATLGFLFYYFRILEKFNNNWNVYFPITLLFLFISFRFNVFPTKVGFGYSGLNLIIMSMCLIFVANTLNRVISRKQYKFITVVSQYTLGIYCMHRLVGSIFAKIFNLLDASFIGFAYCILIYIICYLISLMMARISYLKGLVV